MPLQGTCFAAASLRLQSHVSKALVALVEPEHEAGACGGCATLAAAQLQSTCRDRHARIAGRARSAHRFLTGKSGSCGATRAFSVAHRRIRLRRPRTQPHTARPRHCRGFEPTSVQLARCNAEATTQALAHQEYQRTLSGPAASHCYGAASTAAGQRHLPSAIIEVGCYPEPAASSRAVG